MDGKLEAQKKDNITQPVVFPSTQADKHRPLKVYNLSRL